MGAEPIRPAQLSASPEPAPATAGPQATASIVIPVRDHLDITRACLSALRRQHLEAAEVVVVDDGSQSPTAAALAAHGDELRLVRHERNRGYAAACNSGVAASDGELVILLNNDTLPEPGWLDALRAHAEAHPSAGIIGARLLWPDHTIQHAGVVVGAGNRFHHLYVGFPGDHPAPSRSRRLQMVTGAAMLVRRQLWDALGGFDLAFTNGYEDLDLCLRAAKLGYEVHLCGDAVLYHLESATRTTSPAGDSANHRRFVERWGTLEPDDLEHYAEDGLIAVEHVAGEIRVRVSPELGRVTGPDGPEGTEVEQLLDRRALECFELRRENLDLRRALADPWADRLPPPEPVAGLPSVSIVTPMSDHGHLPEMLEALRSQTYPADQIEVLAVNAGERIPAATAQALAEPRGLRLRVLDTATPGRAAAFNRGIAEATGAIVILLADDFLPCREFVEQHVLVHRDDPRPETVGIGPARFPERLREDPFTRWLEDGGSLFGVSFTHQAGELPPEFFFGGNASCKRSFMLEAGPFNEAFPGDAWDDYEFGRRLVARGMRSRLVTGAVAVHDHILPLAERRAVMKRAGRAARIYDGLYPDPHPWHSGVGAEPVPSLARVARARARCALTRRDHDRAAYFTLTLDRAFRTAYRAAAGADPQR